LQTPVIAKASAFVITTDKLAGQAESRGGNPRKPADQPRKPRRAPHDKEVFPVGRNPAFHKLPPEEIKAVKGKAAK
jgi:hypothetical protein